MRPTSSLAAALAAAALGLCAPVTHPQVRPGDGDTGIGRLSAASVMPSEIPLEVAHGCMIVHVNIGAGQPARAVVDTSLPICVVSRRVADDEKLVALSEKVIRAPFGLLQTTIVRAAPWRLGRVIVEDAATASADLAVQLTADTSAGLPELWIGMSVLRSMAVTLDVEAQRMRLERSPVRPEQGAQIAPVVLRDGCPEVTVRANGGAPFAARLSTSSAGTMIPGDVARTLNLVLGTSKRVKLAGGLTVDVAPAMVKELAIGGAKVGPIKVQVVSSDQPSILCASVGVLGNDVFQRFRTTLDCRSGRLMFAPLRRSRPATKL